jgi:hypothetical protein
LKKPGFIFFIMVGFLFTASPAMAGGERGAKDFDLIVAEDTTRDGRITVRIKAKRAFSLGTTRKRNKEYKTVPFESCLPTKRKGFPEVSYFRMMFQLSNNRNYELVVQELTFNEVPYQGEWLPSRGKILRSEDPSKIPYEMKDEAKVDVYYPQSEFVVLGNPFLIREVRGIGVTIYPVLINTVQKKVKILKSIKFELVPVEERIAVNQAPQRPLKIFSQNEPVLNALFDNFRWTDELDDGPGHMLVIYTDRDKAAIQPFITHKESLGFTVAEKKVARGKNVKSIIQDAYDADHDLLYVQLVGDWADIKCDTYEQYGQNYPMDNSLGLVSGTDDFYDLIISRFSADSAVDVTTQVNKVITYETNPDEAWWNKALGIASDEGPGDDGEYDNEHMNIIKNNKLVPAGYTVYDEYDPGASASGVASVVNGGVQVINYVGHGYMDGWVTSDFDSTNVNALTNGDKLPFIFSVACNVGEYQSGTCFAEAWQRKQNGGSVSTLMSTISQDWYPPMRGQDYMNDLLTGGYDYSTNPGTGTSTDSGKIRLGSIVFNAFNLQMADTYANSGDVETTKTWILFGDGSLRVVGGEAPSPECPDCSGEPLTNITFQANSTCACTRTTPLTLGDEVIVESGATVTFEAPLVTVTPGFKAHNGSQVEIRQPQ